VSDTSISNDEAGRLVDHVYEAVMSSLQDHIQIVRAYQSKKVVNDSVVYEYDDKGLARRLDRKRNAIRTLNKGINKIRKSYNKDMTSDNRVVRYSALAVAVIDEIYERVGDRSNTGTGVTSFKRKHVKVTGSKIKFKYVGKSGVRQEKSIDNPHIAKAMKELIKDKKPGGFIFDFVDEGKDVSISSKEVNGYLSQFKVTAKDLRGYAANRLLYDELKSIRKGSLPKDEDDRKRLLKEELKEAISIVAEKVGHEPGTCKSQYIMPEIIEGFLLEGKVKKVSSIDDVLMKQGADIVLGMDNLIAYGGFKDWWKNILNKVVPEKLLNIFKSKKPKDDGPKEDEPEPEEVEESSEEDETEDFDEIDISTSPEETDVEVIDEDEKTDSVDREIDFPYNPNEVVLLVRNIFGDTEDHCEDCATATETGLIPITDMLKQWGFPGTRQCRHNCDCTLYTEDGRQYEGPHVSKHARLKKEKDRKKEKDKGISVFRQNFDLGMSGRAPSTDDDEYNATSIPDDRSNNTGHL